MQLSPHFTLKEFTHSQTASRKGISNNPSTIILKVLEITADRMEKIRSLLGDRPITISSGYRSPEVNQIVGGSSTSDHVKGLAVDFNVSGMSVSEVVAKLRNSGIEFDQIIDEFGSWVHIGFGGRMRKQVLKARLVNGRTVYTNI